jgi:transposase
MKKDNKDKVSEVAKQVIANEEHPCPHCSQESGHHPDCLVTKALEWLEKEGSQVA